MEFAGDYTSVGDSLGGPGHAVLDQRIGNGVYPGPELYFFLSLFTNGDLAIDTTGSLAINTIYILSLLNHRLVPTFQLALELECKHGCKLRRDVHTRNIPHLRIWGLQHPTRSGKLTLYF